MLPSRWLEICRLYDDALKAPQEERILLLERNRAKDALLVAEVESLLAGVDREGLLDSGVAGLDDFQPSAIIAGRFQIAALLGRGGMGEVYEAEDLHLGERIALKTIRPEMALNPVLIDRFKKEIQIAKRVTHRNVCRIYDVGFHPSPDDPDTRLFLTMELLPGQTLAQRLTSGPMTVDEALPVIAQLAEGLGAAHQADVIHRDFKTSNVMIASDHGGIRAVITDFGLARAFDPAKNGPGDLTTDLLGLAGTPAYMAPEQLTGGPITPATDIYAFGLVIYEMVTGTRPFRGESLHGTTVRRLNEAPASPRLLAPSLNSQWEGAILRCLHPSPDARFQKTSELLNALTGCNRRYLWKFAAAALAIIGFAIAAFLPQTSNNHLVKREEWQQLTNFADSATDPAFSPDGRMLAFKLGGNWFMNQGQIYVKMLPDGPPVQITSEPTSKMAPVFSPDGSSVAYSTTTDANANWQMARTSVLTGGEGSRLMMRNAEGLSWIDKEHILFSEKRLPEGLMAVVTATESRTDQRDVYVPARPTWMAHFSSISPDHKQVLIVEMEPGPGTNASEFFPCRLVPFDGSSKGRLVGPVPGHCISAAWSPDGKWMYFSARNKDNFHLWRQNTAGGVPEQITSGPTQEKGFAIAPDGRSVVASVGVDQTTVWLHDADGEHQISGEGNARSPVFSPDGTKVYYLWAPDLWVADLASGHAERVLPGVGVAYYAISPDGKGIAYTSSKDRSLWYGPIDRSVPARRLAADGISPQFTIAGDIFFKPSLGSGFYRVRPDGSGLQDLSREYGDSSAPISSVSPDERWAIRENANFDLQAYSRDGSRLVHICERCYADWSPDGRFFIFASHTYAGKNSSTALIPLKAGVGLPDLPLNGIRGQKDLAKILSLTRYHGHFSGVAPAPDGSSYAFGKKESHWNLYRIPLP